VAAGHHPDGLLRPGGDDHLVLAGGHRLLGQAPGHELAQLAQPRRGIAVLGGQGRGVRGAHGAEHVDHGGRAHHRGNRQVHHVVVGADRRRGGGLGAIGDEQPRGRGRVRGVAARLGPPHPGAAALPALQPAVGLQPFVGRDHRGAADRQRRREGALRGQDRAQGDLPAVHRPPQRIRDPAVQRPVALEVQQLREVRASLANWFVQYQSNYGVLRFASGPTFAYSTYQHREALAHLLIHGRTSGPVTGAVRRGSGPIDVHRSPRAPTQLQTCAGGSPSPIAPAHRSGGFGSMLPLPQAAPNRPDALSPIQRIPVPKEPARALDAPRTLPRGASSLCGRRGRLDRRGRRGRLRGGASW
jgi:hypothetical protein